LLHRGNEDSAWSLNLKLSWQGGVENQDHRQLLARRLRGLREHLWADRKITQLQLAQALGGDKPLSVPLISSWESQAGPRIPPPSRLDGYAAVFATPRTFDGPEPCRLSPEEMTEEERSVMNELRQELMRLRNNALRDGALESETAAARIPGEQSFNAGPWRFPDGHDITIVCAQWPPHMLSEIPYTDVDDPDYIELLNYSELDALFELHGHLRAANPDNQVNLRIAGKLTSDDYTSHLVSLGGVDWNTITSTALERLSLPVQQIANWEIPGEQYFQVEENGAPVKHRAVLEESVGHPKGTLREDVALFARATSPFNRKRTITICNGMYGRGTYGAVRGLTDARFRDRNADYLRSRFGDSETYCVLTRVPILYGATLTPDWTNGEYTLFEWSR
jgi:transcriptional regulator with XRE-family HTH domain